jgi:DNA-binding transcriptional LysR family regulator
MNWRFDDIVTFMSVVEAGGITSAATRLNVSKSVISKRIRDLEAALRVELFHRSTGNVKPTELARAFYERIVPLIRGITEATDGVSQRTESLTGRLRVTAPISIGTNFLGPVIAAFARRHPELEIAVDYEDRLVNLTQAGYDLGVRIGDLKESSLKARKLCDCVRIVCCSPDYAANHGLPKDVADLAVHACIDYAHVRTSEFWQFDMQPGGGRPISVMMRSRIIANNLEAMRDMAIAGLGLVLLPDYLAAGPLQEGTLIPALPKATPRLDPISAVYPYTHHVSSKVRAFIDHLVVAFAPPLPWHRDSRGTGDSISQSGRVPESRPVAAWLKRESGAVRTGPLPASAVQYGAELCLQAPGPAGN